MGQLSVLMEASSPKPGNVNRLRRFSDTGYRHFVASACLVGRGLHAGAEVGVRLAKGGVSYEGVRIGRVILQCANDVFTGLSRRNTILGTILLHAPLVVSLAAAVQSDSIFTVKGVKTWIEPILRHTSVRDTLDVYRAFHLAQPGGRLNKGTTAWTEKHDRYDIDNPNVYRNIRKDQITLYELFRAAADVDVISKEWAECFRLTLDEVFPHLDSLSHGLEDIEEAIVATFLWLLSKQPDGLIAKKAGPEKAEQVRAMAKRVLEEQGGESRPGELLRRFDEMLRRDGNRLNPGTTADLVSAATFCKLVSLTYP